MTIDKYTFYYALFCLIAFAAVWEMLDARHIRYELIFTSFLIIYVVITFSPRRFRVIFDNDADLAEDI